MTNTLTDLFKDFNLMFCETKNILLENKTYNILKDVTPCFSYHLYISKEITILDDFKKFTENIFHQKVNLFFYVNYNFVLF